MTFERTRDLGLVRAILTDPTLYPYLTDDFSGPREEFRANDHPAIWYVLALADDGELLGLFSFCPENQICWSGHVAFFRGITPAVTRYVGEQIVKWLWENTCCLRLIASIPACNRAAVKFARGMGLKAYGRNKASFMKGGKLWDQVLMGRSKD
jgi:RimJ/RimL family protein N-acetyltransferase